MLILQFTLFILFGWWFEEYCDELKVIMKIHLEHV